ncbi:MAG: hypothetical protein K8I30_02725, partial [Anaerolineae bacterium]|nr:hypothetical protein [Anaerolineae bacterium]
MRNFALKLGLFLLPFILLLGTPLALAVYSGEAMPLYLVDQLTAGDQPAIYAPALPGIEFAYKLRELQARQPEVVVTGSSRMYMFRAELFHKNPDAFYNA